MVHTLQWGLRVIRILHTSREKLYSSTHFKFIKQVKPLDSHTLDPQARLRLQSQLPEVRYTIPKKGEKDD